MFVMTGGNDNYVMRMFTNTYGDQLVTHPTSHVRRLFGMTFRQTSPMPVNLAELVFERNMLDGYDAVEVMQCEGNAGYNFAIFVLEKFVTIENFQESVKNYIRDHQITIKLAPFDMNDLVEVTAWSNEIAMYDSYIFKTIRDESRGTRTMR
jgi:hypothetical protein